MQNKSAEVRASETLDLEVLLPFLQERLEGFEKEIQVSQYPAGHSNLTYLLESPDRQWVLRRPPFGANIKSGHDMSREYRILKAIRPVYPRVPEVYLLVEDDSPIDAPFYLMEKVDGAIYRGAQGFAKKTPEQVRLACHALIEKLAELHNINVEEAGLADLGRGPGYIERQVEGWAGRYERAMTDDAPDFTPVVGWLRQNMPQEIQHGLIHNDYKYDNVLYDAQDPSSIRAVFDWEMATVGDTRMDLGTSLAYWIEPEDPAFMQAFAGPTVADGNLRRKEIADLWSQKTNITGDFLFFYVYGLFKVAGIAQQIYNRYSRGVTTDKRFGALIHAVNAMRGRALQALETQSV